VNHRAHSCIGSDMAFGREQANQNPERKRRAAHHAQPEHSGDQVPAAGRCFSSRGRRAPEPNARQDARLRWRNKAGVCPECGSAATQQWLTRCTLTEGRSMNRRQRRILIGTALLQATSSLLPPVYHPTPRAMRTCHRS